nr:MAG TPA: hypothetical protein [Caudoviricetes sp.]
MDNSVETVEKVQGVKIVLDFLVLLWYNYRVVKGHTACEVVQVSTVNPTPPHHYGVAGMHNFSSNLKDTKYKWVQP